MVGVERVKSEDFIDWVHRRLSATHFALPRHRQADAQKRRR